MERRKHRSSSPLQLSGLQKPKKKKTPRRRPMTKKERTLQLIIRCAAFAAAMAFVIFVGAPKASLLVADLQNPMQIEDSSMFLVSSPDMDVDLLDEDAAARSGYPIDKIRGIVIHYECHMGSGAQEVRDSYEEEKEASGSDSGSHFVIGSDGEIVQCIPCTEVSAASGNRNDDTISITCCISDPDSKPGDSQYKSLVHLTAWLVLRYDLQIDDLLLHDDVSSVECPQYFVDNPSQWRQFKSDVYTYIQSNSISAAD